MPTRRTGLRLLFDSADAGAEVSGVWWSTSSQAWSRAWTHNKQMFCGSAQSLTCSSIQPQPGRRTAFSWHRHGPVFKSGNVPVLLQLVRKLAAVSAQGYEDACGAERHCSSMCTEVSQLLGLPNQLQSCTSCTSKSTHCQVSFLTTGLRTHSLIKWGTIATHTAVYFMPSPFVLSRFVLFFFKTNYEAVVERSDMRRCSNQREELSRDAIFISELPVFQGWLKARMTFSFLLKKRKSCDALNFDWSDFNDW